jgi:outer membrane lipoprotein-sorting protein
MNDDEPELGALLALLHRADDPFTTVEATYRVWRHDARASAAFRADIEHQKRRGASVGTIQLTSRDGSPAEHDELLRIWRSGDRVRVEHEGGQQDGGYGVRDGTAWWMWDERNGALSNQDDRKVGNGMGEEVSVLLNPTPLLGLLRFGSLGRSTLAGRATITAEAVPRLVDSSRSPRSFELHRLGSGADRYVLHVDAELGVLLSVVAFRDGEPFRETSTVEIAFDQPIDDDRFVFQPPVGEEIRSSLHRSRPERMPIPEAQKRAPFTVLIPDRVPTHWHVHCVFVEPSERPVSPAHLSLNYNSEDGHERVNLSQCAANEKQSQYDELIRGKRWDEVIRDGTTIRVSKPGAAGNQTQAHLEREGTFVFLMSETLGAEPLTNIAAGLRAAPSNSSV